MTIAPVDLAGVIRRAATSLNAPDSAAIVLDIAPVVPQIQADADRIEQVVRLALAVAR